MSTKGQTINDRLNAAKYTLAGQALARCICKATTEELMRPKKKHLDYLASCTYEPNVSMLQLSNMLLERTNHSNWAVVYKALITVHHLMSYGSERFTQYLASSNYSFQLSGFLDRIVPKGYAMSAFIRRYSNYIDQKALSYRTLATDLCRSQKSSDNILRSMPIERLLSTLPVIQKQLDSLLDFGCTANDLNNSIIIASFTLLFHDLIRLFASYNDGIINLFEKYFDLNRKMCREAFEAYKKFLTCTDRVAEFLKVAEAINLDRGDIPDFKRAPSSLLDALEQHLTSLETNKKRDKVWIDTKLAALPSFSAGNDSDFIPPTLGSIAAGLDAQLTFSSEESEFDRIVGGNSHKQSDNNNSVPQIAPIILAAPSSKGLEKKSNVTSLADDLGPQLTSTSLNPFDDFDAEPTFGQESTMSSDIGMGVTTTSSSNDLFDLNPPGYSGGALLTPELTLQTRIDPSIDPQTQQQLIQIQREQAANKQRQSSSNNGPFSPGLGNPGNSSSYSSSGASKKSKHESLFEDLEKSMRQSLFKAEKA